MVKKAYKDTNLQPEGRVALLTNALRTARDASAPNWGRTPEQREEVFGKLEGHIKSGSIDAGLSARNDLVDHGHDSMVAMNTPRFAS